MIAFSSRIGSCDSIRESLGYQFNASFDGYASERGKLRREKATILFARIAEAYD